MTFKGGISDLKSESVMFCNICQSSPQILTAVNIVLALRTNSSFCGVACSVNETENKSCRPLRSGQSGQSVLSTTLPCTFRKCHLISIFTLKWPGEQTDHLHDEGECFPFPKRHTVKCVM